jgi:transcriptional regulator with XRE-family HTH domain
MAIQENKTSEELEQQLGEQVRRLRLQHGFTQVELAGASGLSLGAIRGLEAGSGSSLKTLILVVRHLNMQDWLSHLAPAVRISPMDLLRITSKTERQRAYKPRTARAKG